MKRSVFSVMTDPRGYIRDLPKEKEGRIPIFLAWVIGMVYVLGAAFSLNLGSEYSFGLIILLAVILAIPLAYIKVFIFAVFLYWAGWLFKGKASCRKLFSAAAFGMVPDFFILLGWFFLLILFGRSTFIPKMITSSPTLLVTLILLSQIVFFVWGFVITLHTIGEVQKFSAWMSLWNYILAFVLIGLVDLLVKFILAMAFSLQLGGVDTVSKVISLII